VPSASPEELDALRDAIEMLHGVGMTLAKTDDPSRGNESRLLAERLRNLLTRLEGEAS
jgi:hypothetical protein